MTIQRSRLSLRNLLVSAAFVGVMAFGALQAVASNGAPDTQVRACSSICNPECPGFGGSYIAGKCYCCG